jgi:hypothetical protein
MRSEVSSPSSQSTLAQNATASGASLRTRRTALLTSAGRLGALLPGCQGWRVARLPLPAIHVDSWFSASVLSTDLLSRLARGRLLWHLVAER